jgi:hypothetical protein
MIQESYDSGLRNFSYTHFAGVNLRGANLPGANFTGATLTYVNFVGAYLPNTNFTSANLSNADFTGARLTGARLSGTNFTDAVLIHTAFKNANLVGANFTGATLTNTSLIGVDFKDTVLTGTCLDPAAIVPPLTDEEILAAGLEIDGEWVCGWRTERSRIAGGTKYVPRTEPYVAPIFSVDQYTSCHPGIYLADRKWLADHYGKHEPVVRCRCRRDELLHSGYKWRAKRLWIEAEKE